MNDREKLIDLMADIIDFVDWEHLEAVSDHLIANGVVIMKQGEWCHFHTSIGTAIYSNCHRLDHIAPLASYCRYCGAKMKEVKG